MKSRIISFLITLTFLASGIPDMCISVSAGDSGYYSADEIAIAEGIADAAASNADKYVVTGNLPVDDIGKVMMFVHDSYPKLFNLSTSYKYTYNVDPVTGERWIAAVLLTYSMDGAAYARALEEVDTWISNIVSLASPSFTDYEYAVFFHDYLCANYEYDTSLSIHDLYNFIKQGKGVCQAYTFAYNALLEAVGIEASWASSREMNHMWSLVKLEGKWYHTDITWNDPIGHAMGLARHTYFLKSDSGFSSNALSHFGWVSPRRANATDYDSSAISDVTSAFAYLNDKWYYISDGDLYVTDSPFSKGSLFIELDMVWNVWNSAAIYTSSYSALVAMDGKLYLNTPDSIVQISPENKSVSRIYSYSGNDGYIYGFKADIASDGITGTDYAEKKLLLNIATAPDKHVKDISLSIETLLSQGDANGDGKVNISDASLMLKYIAKWEVSVNLNGADFDGNGKINIADVSGVLKKIAGW